MQNPENPYSNPSGIPPTSPGLPVRGPELTLDAIGQAWKVLQPNLGTWIGVFLVYCLITGALNGVQGAVVPKQQNGLPQYGPIYLLTSLITFAIGQFFLGGMTRMAISNVRTGRAEFGQMFSAGDVLPNLIGAGILTFIATVVGLVFCFVPGLLLSGLFMFVTPLIVDKRQGAIEAIGSSFNALKPQMWMALLFIFVVGLLAFAGLLACGVGILVTGPLALLTIAVAYNNFFYGNQSPTLPPMPPSAPIADPFR